MNNNVARRCPICAKEPTLGSYLASNGDLLVVVECQAHGFIGMGNTFEAAVQLYNALVKFTTFQTAILSAQDPGPIQTSPCLTCKADTESIVFDTPDLYYVQCQACWMIKFERVQKIIPKGRYDGRRAL